MRRIDESLTLNPKASGLGDGCSCRRLTSDPRVESPALPFLPSFGFGFVNTGHLYEKGHHSCNAGVPRCSSSEETWYSQFCWGMKASP